MERRRKLLTLVVRKAVITGASTTNVRPRIGGVAESNGQLREELRELGRPLR
jgi:hypothetical protein